jgi:hypothetical protein
MRGFIIARLAGGKVYASTVFVDRNAENSYALPLHLG